MFPVGLVTHAALTTPVVRNGKVIRFYDGWLDGSRNYPADMAEFAINVDFLKSRPKAMFDDGVLGYQETEFLEKLRFNLTEIEPLAGNCTQVNLILLKKFIKLIICVLSDLGFSYQFRRRLLGFHIKLSYIEESFW